MTRKVPKKSSKTPVVYAFIDSQNLNLGVRSQGWKIDYRKLRLFLKNRYHVVKAHMFIGMMPENADLYNSLTQAGFKLIFKPTVKYLENGVTKRKGNVDAELVLYSAAKLFNEYDEAIIISGDGDFCCLYEYLAEFNKLKRIFTPNKKYSKLLKPFRNYIVRVDQLKSVLEYKNQPKRSVETLGRAGKSAMDRRSVETLGLPKHGDTLKSIAKSRAKVNRKKQK
jgi:uncharacterized LabA/DUF88 family protein